MFLLLLVLAVPLLAVSPPTNFRITGCNGYIRLNWQNPSPSSSYTQIEVYRDTGTSPYLTIANNNSIYNYVNISEVRHEKHSYYLKARYYNTRSVATITLEGYAIRKIYISDNQDGTGSSATDTKDIKNFQTSNGPSGWGNYDWGDGHNGFYKGDSIILVGEIGGSEGSYGSTSAAIHLPNPSSEPYIEQIFPREVYYNGEPFEGGPDKLLFISAHLVDDESNQAIITPSVTGNDFGILTNGTDNIIIKGFQFNEVAGKSITFEDGCWIINASKSSNLIIEDNYFNFTKGNGCIKLQAADENAVGGQRVYSDVKNVYIKNNVIYQGNANSEYECSIAMCYDKVWGGNGDFIQIGLESDNTQADVDNISIYKNTITLRNTWIDPLDINKKNPHTDMIQAYRLKNNSKIYIYQNYFKWIGTRTDNGPQGIHATSTVGGTGEIWVWNNIFYFTAANNAININNYDENIIGYIKLFAYNNTFYKEDAGYRSSYFVQIQKPVGGNEIKNNIFYSPISNNTEGLNFRLLAIKDVGSTTHSIDYNLFHSPKISNTPTPDYYYLNYG
ncbi:MAG: hypothetical protein ACM3O3_08610 [Syntrophothermus sp.]